ncbi:MULTISPECIES: hypothetical protein [Bradyrhizobium]|uniref:hypothetical protein n=1 Tax=Bradyrhizobium TaxID=374 RepID=UPI000485BA94|nr:MULTISPECIES: hypothetical protein [Bradyrhizobium]QOG21230.1 hypothetical protein FOM02_31865 [Bradyrhizobium sp. SEMIA]UFW51766.1 hypothetical protein BaraCB756_12635 [Bradyrhizobium arachidis]SFV16980.1 hypothetical protein SAMN05192541_1274 [Bradyrhizobium arachidis]
MRRRQFLGLISGAAAWSRSARAQQANISRLGSLKLTEPNGKPVHINVAQITYIRSDTQVSGANAELGLASGKIQGVQENVDEVMRLVTVGQRGEMSWIKLTEPSGLLIYVNVSQVTTVRFDSQIPGTNAELGFASGKVHGVQESVDDVMQLIAAIARQPGKPP